MARAVLEPGDCRDVLLEMAAAGESFHACITDPPYHLTSTVKRFGGDSAAPAAPGVYGRSSAGFMGKQWDGGDVAFQPETWRLVFDVLRPGAYLLAFGGTRTFHRMAVAIEDAGFEIRDTVMWLYGSGFPKSRDVSKVIDKAAGAKGTFGAAKTAAHERYVDKGALRGGRGHDGWQRPWMDDPVAVANAGRVYEPATPEAAVWSGWGTALKPAWEPIIVARKPLVGTIAANVLAHSCGALNIDASRVPLPADDKLQAGLTGTYERLNTGAVDSNWGFMGVPRAPGLGRWPANVIHDGSDEVLEAFAGYGERGARADVPADAPSPASSGRVTGKRGRVPSVARTDTGTAARFFYSAKAGAADRAGSRHPTVKPLSLMRYLCRLVTPPGGRVLDPFAGSGSTLQAAVECGFGATGVERDPEYQADIGRRLAALADSELEAMLA